MFSFLNSLILPAIAAVVIPIIIHFFNRRKTKKIQFSSLRFLKMLENQRIRQVRLLQIILILIRTLFILFLVLAFARPVLKSTFMGNASAATTAVILLDDSYSMQSFEGSVSKFAAAIDLMADILDTFTPDDRVFILPFSDVPSNPIPVNLNLSTRDIVKKYRVTNHSPDISKAFNTTDQIFEDHPNFNRELYLLSDFNISRLNISDSIETILENREILSYLVNTKGEAQTNIGIDSVIVENQLFEVNKPVQFTIQLKNHDIKRAKGTLVNLYNGSNRLAMQQTGVDPAEMKPVNLTFVPKKPGQLQLQFEIEDDNLLLDNHYYLTITIPDNIKILFVIDQPAAEIRTALDIMDTNSVLKIDQFNYGQWIGKNFDNYDLIALYNPPRLGIESVHRLKRYLQHNNVLIIPGDNLFVQEFNNVFGELTESKLLDNLNTTPGGNGYFALNANVSEQYLFKPVFIKEKSKIELPKIFKYYTLAGKYKSIIDLENNSPLLAEYETDVNNRVIIFTSLLENDWNDIAYKGFFMPMFYRILFTASQSGRLEKSYKVGDKIALTMPDLSLSDRYTIQAPGGETYDIIPQQSAQGIQISIDQIKKPGHYSIWENDRFIHSFSVNLSSKELARPYLNFENLSENVILIDDNADIIESIQTARTGQELWYIFLALALLMLLLEVLIIKKIEGQSLKTN